MGTKREADGLTANERAYAEERGKGTPPTAAYNATYGDAGGKPSTRARSAYEVEHRPNVTAMIERHRAINEQMAREAYKLDTAALIAEVAEIINNPETSAGVKLQAIDRAARLQGLYTDRTEHTGSVALDIEAVRREQMAALLGEETAED